MSTAIVLSGGGSRGDFQLGALTALEEMGIRADIICSTSVGSLNALMLTQGDQGVADLRRIWMGLRRNDHMWRFDDWWDEIRPELRKIVVDTINGDKSAATTDFWSVRSSLLFGGSVGAVALGPIGFVMGALTGAAIAGTISDIESDAIKDALRILGQRAQSVLNISPVRDMMNVYFSRDRFREWVNSGKKLRLAVVGLGSGQLAYVTEGGELVPRLATASIAQGIDILDAAMASAAIATVFRPVEFAGDLWVDGGHRESIPLRAALDAGANAVYVISASPIDPMSSINRTADGLISNRNFARERILAIAERALLDIHLDEIAAGDVFPVIASSTVPITVIAPKYPTHDIVTIDPDFIRANYNYGYRQAYDAVGNAPADKRDNSDTMALNDGQIARFKRQVWHQSNVPLNRNVPIMRRQNADLGVIRVNQQLRVMGPVTDEAFPRGSELVPGDRLLPGQAIASPDARFRLIYQTDGNLVLYEDRTGIALWATSTDGRPLGTVVMQRDGNLVVYDEDMNVLWASGSNGNPDTSLRIQSDGNLVIHDKDRKIWETRTGRQRPRPMPRPGGPGPLPVIRTFTMVNGSPQTIYVRYFKLDDTVFLLSLGEFTLVPGQSVDWTFPTDVDAVKVRINQHHEMQAEPGQTVTFTTDDRLRITNRTVRTIDVDIYSETDHAMLIALPNGIFRLEPNAEAFWDFPQDIDRAVVAVNHSKFETVLRGAQIEYEIERHVSIFNRSGQQITVRIYRLDDTWRWVALLDTILRSGISMNYEVPADLEGVQLVLQGVTVRAMLGERFVFENGLVATM